MKANEILGRWFSYAVCKKDPGWENTFMYICTLFAHGTISAPFLDSVGKEFVGVPFWRTKVGNVSKM